MATAAENIITVNAGSSSIKMAVFTKDKTAAEAVRQFTVSITGIRQPTSTLQFATPEATKIERVQASDHIAASRIIIKRLAEVIPPDNINAIGHRLVHGGERYINSTRVAAITEYDWELFSLLDPEHTQVARQLIDQFSKLYPSITQVACFDTAFFRDLPLAAQIEPIPKKYFAEGVRRYGFHGLSYESLLKAFGEQAGEMAASGRIILAHLGSGTSVTAVRHGKPIDTTMGFTPTSGVIMGTRSGDLDPNIFGFLQQQYNMSIDEFDHMVRFESGLLGVSGVTGDMHRLLAIEHENEDVALAIELFVRSIKKAVGALAATLGGVDSIIFSGGIGEQSAVLRARICQDLAYMGIKMDEEANTHHAFRISSDQSRVGVHVITTDEASMLASKTLEFIKEMENV